MAQLQTTIAITFYYISVHVNINSIMEVYRKRSFSHFNSIFKISVALISVSLKLHVVRIPLIITLLCR